MRPLRNVLLQGGQTERAVSDHDRIQSLDVNERNFSFFFSKAKYCGVISHLLDGESGDGSNISNGGANAAATDIEEPPRNCATARLNCEVNEGECDDDEEDDDDDSESGISAESPSVLSTDVKQEIEEAEEVVPKTL